MSGVIIFQAILTFLEDRGALCRITSVLIPVLNQSDCSIRYNSDLTGDIPWLTVCTSNQKGVENNGSLPYINQMSLS